MKITESLQDPNGCTSNNPELFLRLKKKISDAKTNMYRKPTKGGNPFLYFLTGSKNHILTRTLPGSPQVPLSTACTNGREFFWCPEFLDKLSSDECSIVMDHEMKHLIYEHCGTRFAGYSNQDILNIVLDLFVNGYIEHDKMSCGFSKDQIWTENLGPTNNLKNVLDWVDGDDKAMSGKTYCDASLVNKSSPEEIYELVMSHCDKSPRKCKKCSALSLDPKTGVSRLPKPWSKDACPVCGAKPNSFGMPSSGGGMDSHIKSDLGKQEVLADLIKASSAARMCGQGNIPSDVADVLAEMEEPTLSVKDVLLSMTLKIRQGKGDLKNYSVYNRRSEYIYENVNGEVVPVHKLFRPTKKEYTPKFLVMVDTSGSMSDADIVNGMKEIKLVARVQRSEGLVVPCDCTPKWEKAVKIQSESDLVNTNIVGRGGTDFAQFFRDYRSKVGADWDLIIMITDGDFGNIPKELAPPTDVLWIITNERSVRPPFGRMVQLKRSRR